MRIRPQEIEVPEHNPFENDLLDRKESVEVLTRLVSNLEGPSVLAVDAVWGNGKSTFIRIWEQYLRNQGFAVVKFNAWETDFSKDPFVSLSSEVTEGLAGNDTGDEFAAKLERMKEAGKEVLKRSVPGMVRLATAGILDISPLLQQEIGQFLASYAEERFAEYIENQSSVREFNLVLDDVAATLSACHGNRPLVIFVDELDRCRPSYAIELLEIAKHFFSVDHIVFVLAVNRSELAHSIKAFYGSEFDAIGYLRRFIDIDFRLPDPDRRAFVNAILADSGVDAFSDSRKPWVVSSARDRSLLQAFFSVPGLSLRRISQAIRRLGIMLTLLQSDRRTFFLPVTTALILRTINPEMHHSFFRGEVSDLEVADNVFRLPELKSLRRSDEGVLFETMLIVATHEVGFGVKRWPVGPDETISPLLRHYQGRISSNYDGSDQQHAQKIISCVKEFQRYIDNARRGQSAGFRQAIEQLELFSYELADERPA